MNDGSGDLIDLFCHDPLGDGIALQQIPNAAPEPATLVLLGLGIGLIGLRRLLHPAR